MTFPAAENHILRGLLTILLGESGCTFLVEFIQITMEQLQQCVIRIPFVGVHPPFVVALAFAARQIVHIPTEPWGCQRQTLEFLFQCVLDCRHVVVLYETAIIQIRVLVVLITLHSQEVRHFVNVIDVALIEVCLAKVLLYLIRSIAINFLHKIVSHFCRLALIELVLHLLCLIEDLPVLLLCEVRIRVIFFCLSRTRLL